MSGFLNGEIVRRRKEEGGCKELVTVVDQLHPMRGSTDVEIASRSTVHRHRQIKKKR